ncbi:putative thioredoxin-like 2 variant 3 [Syncephalis pseudoplumigaleata]|uniref:Putative thioredoxin-like 2 variant 3 n=1 Tax=Syncephalis pseudoplumigaleata TaxID=1712513 RepID=A0A4P9YWE6_9FUNG|nr:putative thioredoxin-like 2 variant 3 [Syncephalis pseudoplumigaleata]|eukprot:RKP24244.1 putative thioredoxin-like 2 variant 3 [Syncephalis pseudoplumigaleata]
MTVTEIASEDQLQALLTSKTAATSVLNFWAAWAQQCKQMNQVFTDLARQYKQLQFIQVEAEKYPEVSEGFDIEAVPTFIFVRNGKQVDRVNGANVAELTAAVERQLTAAATSTAASSTSSNKPRAPLAPPVSRSEEELEAYLKALTHRAPVMIFIKGSPDTPRCSFSKKLVALLNSANITYDYFDILGDEQVRQGLKKYSDWPTYPQLYIRGELQGGLDIVTELHASGELAALISAS